VALELTILYDNESLAPSLTPDWGFSALIVNGMQEKVLFDTGANGAILERNAIALGVNLGEVSHVVLSHWHWDHTGGLETVMHYAPRATYHVPPGVGGIPPHVDARMVGPKPVEIVNGVYSTGVLDRTEQGMVLLTGEGSFLVTGCAHPGVEPLLEAAATLARPVGVLGGFHGFSRLEHLHGLSQIYPCHCTQRTGDILKKYPNTAATCGAGFRLELPVASPR